MFARIYFYEIYSYFILSSNNNNGNFPQQTNSYSHSFSSNFW